MQMKPCSTRSGRRVPFVGLAAILLASALLAGCSENMADNEAPTAKLEATKEVGWTGETFTFDAQDSEDDDGEITNYRFDFGDGTKQDAAREDDARVSHVYATGGQYAVTVTVTDDGRDREGSLTDSDTVQVAVNERRPVAAPALAAETDLPGVPTGNTSTDELEFEVHEQANRFELDLNLTSLLAAGASEITVKVTDPDGNVLDEQTVTVDPSETETIDLEGLLTKQGDHAIELEANSGAASVEGELRVYYGET